MSGEKKTKLYIVCCAVWEFPIIDRYVAIYLVLELLMALSRDI